MPRRDARTIWSGRYFAVRTARRPLALGPADSVFAWVIRPPAASQVAIPDPALGVPVGLTDIYLPAGYAEQAGRRSPPPDRLPSYGYPAGRASDWMASGRAPEALDAPEAYGYGQPMVNVSVDASRPSNGQDWECLNTASGPQLETYLTRNVAYVDGHLATREHRGGPAIGGMSGGAFCALDLGLRHQDLYSAITAMEPFDDPRGQALALLGGSITVLGREPAPHLPANAAPAHAADRLPG